MEEIINKVAASGLITLNLEDFLPASEGVLFDLKEFLFMEMILKEKEYRAALQGLDWSRYRDKNVALGCTVDAIIPNWAYMLAVSYLEPIAGTIVFGDPATLQKTLLLQNLSKINPEEYRDQRIVIKGCGDITIPPEAYAEVTRILRPVAKSILYGEPCSTVPVYKRK